MYCDWCKFFLKNLFYMHTHAYKSYLMTGHH